MCRGGVVGCLDGIMIGRFPVALGVALGVVVFWLQEDLHTLCETFIPLLREIS